MVKTHAIGMEELPAHAKGLPYGRWTFPIGRITDERMSEMRHMDANLMRPARLQGHIEHRIRN
jgi:hypothetical protein